MRRLFWAAMGVALISMVFAGCKKETTYSVQVTANEGGTVEGQNGEYKEGETVVFKAVPADGYYFSKWSNGSTENPRTIAVYSDITLTAEFVQKPLLTISASDNGTIETDVNGRYAPGSNVTVTATPNSGYFFSQWSDGNCDNPRIVTIDASDVTISAEFVDAAFPIVNLGLPSGTRWARCNLGAANPWDYGDYYAWGETQTKDDYSWETYKYCKGSKESITKYHWFTDALTTLLPEDDAATTVLGSEYSMPTVADWNELCSQCYWVWTYNYNNQNVRGYIVYKAKAADDKGIKVYNDSTPSASYSLSDVHIFLPTADLSYAGAVGEYWSASLVGEYSERAHSCFFYSSDVNTSNSSAYRCLGLSVRPVKRP